MKTRLIYSSLISLLLASGFSACSNTPEVNPKDITTKETELKLESDTLMVPVGEETSTKIINGGGNYKVINEAPKIAVATIDKDNINIKSFKQGFTAFILSDDADNYKRIVVKSMYTSIVLDTNEISIKKLLGHDLNDKTIIIKKGNGDYEVESGDENVVKFVTIQQDSIVHIRGIHTGETTIKITDAAGLTAQVKVTVNETDIPFTDEEKQEIMNSDVKRVFWDEDLQQWTPERYNYLTAFNHKVGTENRVGYEYSDYRFIRIFFDGDESVGVYENARVDACPQWYGETTHYAPAKVEIIKNDGTNVWGIVSVIKNKRLYRGYFCLPKQ